MGFFNTAVISILVFAITCDTGNCQRRRLRSNPLGPLLRSLLGGNGGPCVKDDVNLASLLQSPLMKNNLVAQPRLRQAPPCLEAVKPSVSVPQKLIVNPGFYGSKINVPIQNVNVPLQQFTLPYQNVAAPVQTVVVPTPNFVVPTPSISVPSIEKPCAYTGVVPQALVNPFLPAASPVSAIAPPTSNILPPAELSQCRCNYLRKIPIPPPSV